MNSTQKNRLYAIVADKKDSIFENPLRCWPLEEGKERANGNVVIGISCGSIAKKRMERYVDIHDTILTENDVKEPLGRAHKHYQAGKILLLLETVLKSQLVLADDSKRSEPSRKFAVVIDDSSVDSFFYKYLFASTTFDLIMAACQSLTIIFLMHDILSIPQKYRNSFHNIGITKSTTASTLKTIDSHFRKGKCTDLLKSADVVFL